MGEYGTEGFRFADPGVRLLEEADIPAVIELYRLNYGQGYAFPQFYDPAWYRQGIYGGRIIWAVLEEAGRIVASGAIALDYGDPDDQVGELGRMVVHPEWQQRGVGARIHDALLDAADDVVEFAFGEARTVHAAIQAIAERAGFTAAGFLPWLHDVGGVPESFVLYAKLYANGRALRSTEPPRVIPEAAPLARHVLRAMGLPDALRVEDGCAAYPDGAPGALRPLDRNALAALARIAHGRVLEPLLFGGVSLDQGLFTLRRRGAVYLAAEDGHGRAAGALGYQVDAHSRVVRGIELVAETDALRGALCERLLREAERLGARLVEVNVSAYDPRLQRTFADHGFQPAAYLPSMVFHGVRRLDVIRMLRLNEPYHPAPMRLTPSARGVVELVEPAWLG